MQEKTRKIYEGSHKRYGSPRITAVLRAQGICITRKTTAKYMQEMKLQSIVRRKYRVTTTDSNHHYAISDNMLNRDFHSCTLGSKWVGDLTYIKTMQGWLYLTIVMDLADRKIIGWAMSETMLADQTTVAALRMAFQNRKIEKQSLLFHSDRGVQYACNAFRELMRTKEMKQSMSRKGNCWDNAVAESFFKTLKTECIYHHKFSSIAQAKLAIFEYIEVWYNRQRLNSAIRYKTPCQMEIILKNKNQSISD